jgi:hypothetical protein
MGLPGPDVRFSDFLAINSELGTFDRIVMNRAAGNQLYDFRDESGVRPSDSSRAD